MYGSGWDGITIQDGASNNTIGSSAHNERNLIRGCLASGIYVTNANANRILGDGIWNNAYYGIILDGAATTGTYISRTLLFSRTATTVSVSATARPSTSGQRSAPTPTTASASTNRRPAIWTTSSLRRRPRSYPLAPWVALPLCRAPAQTGSLVEVYAGVAPDNSGFGEGKTYLGTATVSSGHWTLNVSSSAARPLHLIENVLGIASSEFGANTCRVMLPTVVKVNT
ncbi:MAG: right-handed parallel beta-helix repeat-containing protein [Anaerolineae bacterium]